MIDLFTWLKQKGVEVRQHASAEGEYKICCPFCVGRSRGPDFRFRLGFNINSGLGHCFRCNWNSRKALLEIMRFFGASGTQLDEIRATPFTQQTRERPKPVKFPSDWTLLQDVDDYDPLWGPQRRYIMKRGVTQKQLKVHEVGATREDSFYYGRVVFPVRYHRMLCGFVGRDWTGESPVKYKNSVGDKYVYNVRYKYPEGKKRIIVCEGVLKALAVERATDYQICCAASLGNSMTPLQTRQMMPFEEVILFPDPDIQGMLGYLSINQHLQPLVKNVTMVWPWPEKQADDMSREEIMELLNNRRWFSPLLRLQIRSQMEKRA